MKGEVGPAAADVALSITDLVNTEVGVDWSALTRSSPKSSASANQHDTQSIIIHSDMK